MLKVINSAVPIACWSCSVSHVSSTLFCPHCSKIQPPPGCDYFQVFGLKRSFQIDLPALEEKFHQLSRKVHPDRFARAEEQEREWSLADTALLNDAYRTLKDPISRTEYLLKLAGAKVDEEDDGKDRSGKNLSRVPADLLEKVFDLNMQLEEMRSARKTGEEDPELKASLTEAKTKFDGLMASANSDLHHLWQVWDDGDQVARQTAQTAMVALLDRRRYLSNMIRDVNETLGA
jgi:molecular chaperone HscB